ncbi:kinase/pyrophosphorylase, partial [uncultured Corynebacterium sp.]|uniref:kinase/pyrophosphorylase n=1 Tax=uncultured Corynebacterium sp. TaxID=159447 RepID=UPI0025F164AB
GTTGAGGPAPLIFLTVRGTAVAAELSKAPGEVIDLLGTHLARLEDILGTERSGTATAYHRVGDLARYHDRIDAVEFSIAHDDAADFRHLDRADLILLAPSRCGKTPTAMYLALQHGLRVANYPLTEDDRPGELPGALIPYTGRLFGLTTTAQRLSEVRGERRPGSGYASLARCRTELREAERLYRAHRIPFIDSHAMSVEEMASIILTTMDLRHT